MNSRDRARERRLESLLLVLVITGCTLAMLTIVALIVILVLTV